MAWSRAFALIAFVTAATVSADTLDGRARSLERARNEVSRSAGEARRAMAGAEQAIALARARNDRAALEAAMARARELADWLHALDSEGKRLDDEKAAVTRDRVAALDGDLAAAQRALEHDAPALDGAALRDRFARIAELRRRRDALAATLPAGPAHRGSDLGATAPVAGEPPDALAEKADLIDSFARGWRKERDEARRRRRESQKELELVRQLAELMQARQRGRIGATDPFGADVEAFELRERERELGAVIATIDARLRELDAWLDEATRRHAEIDRAMTKKEQP